MSSSDQCSLCRTGTSEYCDRGKVYIFFFDISLSVPDYLMLLTSFGWVEWTSKVMIHCAMEIDDRMF